MKPGRKKGTPKTGGRSAGTPNKTTKEAREQLELVMYGQIDNMNEALDRLYKRDPRGYVDACAKLFNYVLPKKTDITSDDKPIMSEAPKIIIKTRNGGN